MKQANMSIVITHAHSDKSIGDTFIEIEQMNVSMIVLWNGSQSTEEYLHVDCATRSIKSIAERVEHTCTSTSKFIYYY